MRYRVELSGFNDGRPYEVGSTDDLEEARKWAKNFRIDPLTGKKAKVPYRVIEVIEDFQ